MKYIVYQTTNLINNKIYIGVHKTHNPEIFDGYYGCGVSKSNGYYFIKNPYTPFQYAIKKYGFKNFLRTTIAVFDNAESAYDLEAKLVDINFIKRKDTYNISLGGNSGNYLYPINQFDLKGNFIKSWDNCKEAALTLGVSSISIINAKNHKTSCLGTFWSVEPNININDYTSKTYRKTYKYDLDGNLISIFETLSQAANDINEPVNKIQRAVLNNYQCNGFYYSYSLCEKYIPKKFTLKNATVYVYDLDGNFVNALQSGKELQEFFNCKSYSNLKQALLQNRPYKNYQIFLYKPDVVNKVSCLANTAKRIGRFSLENQLIEVYDSIREAKRNFGSGVDRVLKGYQVSTRGFIFKYLE